MRLNDKLSSKFKWLSFFATWSVVGLHSGTQRWSETVDWTNAVQAEILKGFLWAVPVFFVISGFLFVASYEKYGYALLKRKFGSLYIPCVCWMVLSELLTLPVTLYTGADFKTLMFLCAPIMAYEKFNISFHFWYVRDLLMLFLAAPIFYWLSKSLLRCGLAFLSVVLAVSLVDCPSFHLGPYTFQYYHTSVLYLLLGLVFARLPELGRKTQIALLILSLAAVVLFWRSPTAAGALFRLGQFGVVWFGFDLCFRNRELPSPWFLTGLFMVYCMHTSVLKFVSGLGRELVGSEPTVKMLWFFVNMNSFWICPLIAHGIRLVLPKTYGILSGRR